MCDHDNFRLTNMKVAKNQKDKPVQAQILTVEGLGESEENPVNIKEHTDSLLKRFTSAADFSLVGRVDSETEHGFGLARRIQPAIHF
jgi:hypothetical protein